jgi:hypothetical protein
MSRAEHRVSSMLAPPLKRGGLTLFVVWFDWWCMIMHSMTFVRWKNSVPHNVFCACNPAGPHVLR